MTSQEEGARSVSVHGMWSDGSIRNKVTSILQRRGCQGVAAQIPLTSLADDMEAVRRIVRRQGGADRQSQEELQVWAAPQALEALDPR
ncbi:MAG TPA: hypothetical protein DEP35_16295 [Deltaproteobacteria bacterium]|nr:hypothetical protein [Deltaproteobacteria bacterium]